MEYTLTQQDIINWLHLDFEGNYTVEFNASDEIIINGNISLINYKLTELPYKFHKVNGDFSIGGFKFYTDNKAHKHAITTLKNCPDIIDGNFNCALCDNLKNLLYGPKEVYGHYNCHNTGITSLDNIAELIKGNIIAFCNYDLINIEALRNISYNVVDITSCNNIIYGSPIYELLIISNKLSNNEINHVYMQNLKEKYNEVNNLK